MPRQPRLDAPGTLHHVMGRGIDGIKIFNNKKDREDFLERLADLSQMSHTFSVLMLPLLIGELFLMSYQK